MAQIDKTKKYRSAESLSWKEYIHDNWQRDLPLMLMLLIPTLYFIIFAYGPMFGLLICFQDFKIGSPFLGEGVTWVGFKWFIDFFNNAFFGRIIRNTLMISLYDLVFVFPLPIIVAIIFNEIRSVSLKGFVQTVSYMPYFLSTPVVVGMMVNFLAPSDGIINQFIVKLGGTAIDFMQEASWFRALYTISSAWSSVGFSSIVFIAAIAGISPSLYEAAYVDGSTRFKNIIHITLPSIAPTIVIMLLLAWATCSPWAMRKSY